MILRSCIFSLVILSTVTAPPAYAQEIDVIAFGSCAREREDQPVWDQMIAMDPDLFLMIGDNQYADFQDIDGRQVMRPVTDTARIIEAYRDLGNKPGFQRMRVKCPMMATWDDHDYGANDMGNDFPLRAESQKVFLDFWGFAEDDPIRQQQGIYHSAIMGPPGKRLQVIMLDTRYHRDPLERLDEDQRTGGPYGPAADESKTMLGEEQWNWLESELRQEADLRLIASSVQVVSDEHGWETWGNMPHERDRLYRLIDETNAEGVFFISGDRHLLEISRDAHRGVPYPIWDFTSSGLNQKTDTVTESNSFRIGPVRREVNFGVIRIDWAQPVENTVIHFEGYGGQSQLLTRQSIFRSDLSQSPSNSEFAILDGMQLPLVFEEDFENGRDNWETTDDSAWTWKAGDDGHVFGLNRRTSDYQPLVRSPHNIALVRDLELADFVMTFDVRSTKDTGNHRDCCVFFAHQSPTQFYYSHLGARPDPNSGQIMIVNNAPRTPMTENENEVPWDDNWHQVKVTRNSASGEIHIYFDDMESPQMSATDKTFVRGRIGIGSFDDMNDFDNIRIYGR